jgi:hypothetical protein
MRNILIATALAGLGGCTPFGAGMFVAGGAGGAVTNVEVEGFHFVVQQSAERATAWGAMRDEARTPLFQGMNVIDLRRRYIAAIEQVSGCAVRPETVQDRGGGLVLLAEVAC